MFKQIMLIAAILCLGGQFVYADNPIVPGRLLVVYKSSPSAADQDALAVLKAQYGLISESPLFPKGSGSKNLASGASFLSTQVLIFPATTDMMQLVSLFKSHVSSVMPDIKGNLLPIIVPAATTTKAIPVKAAVMKVQSAGPCTIDGQTNLNYVQDCEARKISQGNGIIVAVADPTSVNAKNDPGLASRWVEGWNFTTNTNQADNPQDPASHGSVVSNVVAGNGQGPYGIQGIAPQAKIMPIITDGNASETALSIVWAVDHGAKVVTHSYTVAANTLLEQAIRYAHDNNVAIIFAADNNPNEDMAVTPYSMKEVLTVTGTDEWDNPWSGSAFSDYAAVAAPAFYCSQLDGSCSHYGNSFAAPMVAGLCASLMAIHPTWNVDQIYQAIRITADDKGPVGWDINTGYGRINALKALSLANVDVNQARITAPLYGAAVDPQTKSLTISGTASMKNFQSYQFLYETDSNPNAWVPITSAITAAPSQGVLSTTWAMPALNHAERYTIRLAVRSTDGEEIDDSVTVNVDQGNGIVLNHFSSVNPSCSKMQGNSGKFLCLDTTPVIFDGATGLPAPLPPAFDVTNQSSLSSLGSYNNLITWYDMPRPTFNSAGQLLWNAQLHSFDTLNPSKQPDSTPLAGGVSAGGIVGAKFFWSSMRSSPLVSPTVDALDLNTNPKIPTIVINQLNQGFSDIHDVNGRAIVSSNGFLGELKAGSNSITTLMNPANVRTFNAAEYSVFDGHMVYWATWGPVVSGHNTVGSFNVADLNNQPVTAVQLSIPMQNPSEFVVSGSKICWVETYPTDIFVYDQNTKVTTRLTARYSVKSSLVAVGSKLYWIEGTLDGKFTLRQASLADQVQVTVAKVGAGHGAMNLIPNVGISCGDINGATLANCSGSFDKGTVLVPYWTIGQGSTFSGFDLSNFYGPASARNVFNCVDASQMPGITPNVPEAKMTCYFQMNSSGTIGFIFDQQTKPDLMVNLEQPTVATSVPVGGSLPVKFVVANKSVVAAPASQVQVGLLQGIKIMPTMTVAVPALAANSQTEMTVNLPIDATVQPGAYILWVLADPNNKIAEVDDNNNGLNSNIIINVQIPKYNLQVSAIAGGWTGNFSTANKEINCSVTTTGITGTCSYAFNAGATVTLTPTPGPDAKFGVWNAGSGICTKASTPNNCVITMDSAKSITGQFIPYSGTFKLTMTVPKSTTSALVVYPVTQAYLENPTRGFRVMLDNPANSVDAGTYNLIMPGYATVPNIKLTNVPNTANALVAVNGVWSMTTTLSLALTQNVSFASGKYSADLDTANQLCYSLSTNHAYPRAELFNATTVGGYIGQVSRSSSTTTLTCSQEVTAPVSVPAPVKAAPTPGRTLVN